MQGLITVWRGLTPAKQVTLVAAVLLTIGAFSMLAKTATKPAMTLLYAGLEGRASGEVLSALDRLGIDYEVRGEAIYVPQSERDSARMNLAGQGLPQSGQAGYELLDALNGFSTTSDMFDATYWRAKEGELARTILASPGVAAARVHIANTAGGPFSRNATKPTAVVTVTMGRGQLSSGQAQAIRYLVGSAVPGLDAEQVAVLDSLNGVVLSPGETNPSMIDEGDLSDRERKMEADLKELLEARVGVGNARVQVALEINREREQISERVFDPEGRVVSGREINEVTESSSGTGGTSVTVASNLPEGDGNANGQRNNSTRSETREIISYDMSEIRREREKMPGSIRRMSIAVLVNQNITDVGGQVSQREQAELDALRELVAQGAGLDEERGDKITIQSLAFQPIQNNGEEYTANPVMSFLGGHLMSIIQLSVLAVVTLVLGLFVVKPVLASEGGSADLGGDADAIGFSGDDDLGAMPDFPSFDELGDDSDEANPLEDLKGITQDKTDEAANLIKDWLEEEEAA